MKIADVWRRIFSDKITWNVTTIPFKDGDTIVLTTDRVLCNEQRTRLAAHVKSYMPEGAKVVVLDGGLKLSVLSIQREGSASDTPASWVGSVVHSGRPIPHIPQPSPGR